MIFNKTKLILFSYSSQYNSEIENSSQVERRSTNSRYTVMDNAEDTSQEKDFTPVMQSIKRPSFCSTYNRSRGQVYEYKIDPMIEYGPGQTKSFRERNYSYYEPKSAPLRESLDSNTPSKSLLKKRMSVGSAYSSSSEKKTVRFAETEEGLLKGVPFDPSFNDSDFVYDMRHNIN